MCDTLKCSTISAGMSFSVGSFAHFWNTIRPSGSDGEWLPP